MDIVTYALLKKKLEGVASGFQGANLDPNDSSKVILHFANNVDITVDFPGITPDSFELDDDKTSITYGHLFLKIDGFPKEDLGNVQGEKGEKGDSITYVDTKDLKDANDKIIGKTLVLHDEESDSDVEINLENGKPFTFDDLTDEQKEELKGEAGDSFSGYPTTAKQIKDYLYEINYTDLDYEYAKQHWDRDNLANGGCSAIRSGDLFTRNFDWTYDETPDYIVHVPRLGNRYASMGVAPFKIEEKEDYKLIPFRIVDGINECGITACVNVVPNDKRKYTVKPAVETKEKLSYSLLIRYILDNFKTAEEAVNYIRDYIEIPVSARLDGHDYDAHFMIADNDRTFLLEFIDDVNPSNEFAHAVITDMTKDSNSVLDGKSYMTNFLLNGVHFELSGSVTTPEMSDPVYVNDITPYGAGLERYNIFAEDYDGFGSKQSIKNRINDLKYTNAYDKDYKWYSEFVSKELDLDLTKMATLTQTQQNTLWDTVENKFANRDREAGPDDQTWQTVHTSIYNIKERTLEIAVQEDYDNWYAGFSIEELVSLDNGGKAPDEFIKEISLTNSNKTLNWKDQNDQTYSWTPAGGIYTAGKGIIINNDNSITYDDAIIPDVDYVDASISDTMNFIIQERDNEHAGRVAGDNLINTRIDTLETSKQDKLTAGTNITIDANGVISASGAGEENKIESVKVDGTALTIDTADKSVNVVLSDRAKGVKLSDTTTIMAANGIIDLSGQSFVTGNGEANKINSISLDGTALTIDSNKNVNIKLDDKYVKKETGKGLSTKDYTAGEQTKVSKITTTGDGTKYLADDGTYKTISSTGEVNKIEKITKNGTELTITNKTVNIEVPTKTSDLTNDSNFIKNTEVDGTTIKYENGKLTAIGGTGTVKSVKANGTTYNPDANGLIDLGTIAGGTGTITDVKVNNTSVVTNGVANISCPTDSDLDDIYDYIDDSIDDIYADTTTFVFKNDSEYTDIKNKTNIIKTNAGSDKYLAGDGTYKSVNMAEKISDVKITDANGTRTVVNNKIATIDLSGYATKSNIINEINDTNKTSTDKIASIKAIVDFFDNKSKFTDAKLTTKAVGNLATNTSLVDYTWQEVVSLMVYGAVDTPALKGSDITNAGYINNSSEKSFTFSIPTSASFTTQTASDIATKISFSGATVTGNPTVTINNGVVKVTFSGHFNTGSNKVTFAAGAFKTTGDGTVYSGTAPSETFSVSVNVSLNSVPTPAVNSSSYSNDTFTATFNLKDLIGGSATTLDTSKISIDRNAAAIDGTPTLNGNTLTVKLKSKDSNRLNGTYTIVVAEGAIKNIGDGINYTNETKQNASFNLSCDHTLITLPTANLSVSGINNNVMTVGIAFGQGENLLSNYAKTTIHADKISIAGLTSSQFTVAPTSSYTFTITVDSNVAAGDYPVTIGAGAVTVDEIGLAGRKYHIAQTSSSAVSNPGTITIAGSSSNVPDEFGYIEGVDYEYKVEYGLRTNDGSDGRTLTISQIAEDYAALGEDDFWDYVENCGYELWFKGGIGHNATNCLIVCGEASDPVDKNGDPYLETINSPNPALIWNDTYWVFKGSDPSEGKINLINSAYGNMNFVLYKKII